MEIERLPENHQTPQHQTILPELVPELGLFMVKTFFFLNFWFIVNWTLFYAPYALSKKDRQLTSITMKVAPPLVLSLATAGLLSFLWHLLIVYKPATAIGSYFWRLNFYPLKILSVILGYYGSGAIRTAAGIGAILLGHIPDYYSSWAEPSLQHAKHALVASTAENHLLSSHCFQSLAMLGTFLFSLLFVTGMFRAFAATNGVNASVLITFVSLVWMLQVARNTMVVLTSRYRYMRYLRIGQRETVYQVVKNLFKCMGNICTGSVIMPVIEVIYFLGCSSKLLTRGENRFSVYVSDVLLIKCNHYAFVHVGVFPHKSVFQASADTMQNLRNRDMQQLITSDITETFCFLTGVAAGGISSIVAASWAFAIDDSYALELMISVFLVGYSMGRIAVAEAHGCVLAYYVAYSENPQCFANDGIIPARIEQLQLQ